jgi:hypothetical protein
MLASCVMLKLEMCRVDCTSPPPYDMPPQSRYVRTPTARFGFDRKRIHPSWVLKNAQELGKSSFKEFINETGGGLAPGFAVPVKIPKVHSNWTTL